MYQTQMLKKSQNFNLKEGHWMQSKAGKGKKDAKQKEKDRRARARTKEEDQAKELRARHG